MVEARGKDEDMPHLFNNELTVRIHATCTAKGVVITS